MKHLNQKRMQQLVVAASLPLLVSQLDPTTVEANSCQTEKECATMIQENQQAIESLEEQTEEKEAALGEVEKSIDELEAQIESTQAKIKTTEAQIKETNEEIRQSEEELEKLKADISKLKEIVGVRMRVSQRMTRSNMVLNWLSESSSLADLLRSMQVVNQFAVKDASQMDELKELVVKQNELMDHLKGEYRKLEVAKQSLQADQAQLKKDQATLEKKREAVKKEIQALESEKLSAQEAKKFAEEQKALLERLAEEQRRKEEEERKRKEEEERKKQEALLQQQQQQGDGGQMENSPSEPSTPSEPESDSTTVIPTSKTFIIPLATGYVSCEFMCYPGHNGIDLGNSGNTSTPVLATASGIVTRSGWHVAYGNHVMITHNINGQIYTTVYAHMHTTPYVSVGQIVSQGQQIGTMGNTGNSFGAHLHFELYEGYYNYPYSVNPREYINFPSRW